MAVPSHCVLDEQAARRPWPIGLCRRTTQFGAAPGDRLIKHRDRLALAGTVVVLFENVPGNPEHPNGQPGVVGVTQGRRGRDRVAETVRSEALPEALPAQKPDALEPCIRATRARRGD